MPLVLKQAPLYVTFEKGDRTACCGVALPDDGSVVVVGRVDTIAGRSWAWAAKILPSGEVAWEREWSSMPHFSGFNAATEVADNAVIAVGDGEGRGGVVAKIGPTGALAWTRLLNLDDRTRVLEVVGDGRDGVLIAGAVETSSGPSSLFVARVTVSGDIARHSIIGEGDWITALRRVHTGGYVVISDQWDVIRLDESERVRWRQKIDGAMDALGLSDGSLVVLKYPEYGMTGAGLARFDPAGVKLWERRLSEPVQCRPAGTFVRPTDHIIVVTDPCENSEYLSVASFSTGGDKHAVRQIRARVGISAARVRPDTSGGFVAAGMFMQNMPEAKKGWLFRSGSASELVP